MISTRLAIAVCLMTAMLSTLGVAATLALPRAGQPVVALFSPLSRPGDAISAAASTGAVLVDIGRREWLVVLRADAAALARLPGAGAWLVMDARFARFCLTSGYSSFTRRGLPS